MLTAFAENFAKQHGFNKIVIPNARLNVVPFYEKQGYATVGEQYVESGITRRRMGKVL